MRKYKLDKLFTFMTCILVATTINGCSDSKNEDTENNTSKVAEENTITLEVEENEILTTIKDLSTEKRVLGTSEEKAAANKLKSKLESYGYNVQFQDFEVFDVGENARQHLFEDDIDTFLNINPNNSTTSKGIARNVIAKSKDFDETKESLYIFGHYDTSKNTTGVYDNATGVSAVMEVARTLQDYKSDEFNIVYALFSAEEYFRMGSRYYLDKLPNLEKDNITGAINIDMIGYTGFEYKNDEGDWPTVSEIEILLHQENNSATLEQIFNETFDDKYDINNEMGGVSDDLSFFKLGIPTLYFADKNFPTGFNIEGESTDVQLEALEVSSIADLCEDIITFIKNLNINDL